MSYKVCVVIPIYKVELSELEEKSIYNTIEKLSGLDIFFIASDTLELCNYKKFRDVKVKFFPEHYFRDTIEYSRLLLNYNFYKKFIQYEYILIVQTDVWILKSLDCLMSFLEKGYDYWGAPWFSMQNIRPFEFGNHFKRFEKYLLSDTTGFGKITSIYVGNGGLSLRNVKKTIALLKEKSVYAKHWYVNEDAFFGYHGKKNRCGYKIAGIDDAKKFSLEQRAKKIMQEGNIPFGVHAWQKWYPDLINIIQDYKVKT